MSVIKSILINFLVYRFQIVQGQDYNYTLNQLAKKTFL